MTPNPFLLDTFTTKWCEHFNGGKAGVDFRIFKGVKFVKHTSLPLYYNIGSTQTKGMEYAIDSSSTAQPGNKLFVIYDVPDYLNKQWDKNGMLARIVVRQYPGYLIQLHNYNNFEEYFTETFKGKSRYKLRSYKKQLEADFKVQYKMYYGVIQKETYDILFEELRIMMRKRFDEKKIINNNLEEQEWNFYRDLFYPLILDKKACLFVTYANEKPIGMMVNYTSGTGLICAMTVFDIDYTKYNVGSVNNMKLIEWCIENKIKTLDFSKGEYEYKKRWCNYQYYFDYHIFFTKDSIWSRILANWLAFQWKFKNWMRNKGFNKAFYQLKYLSRKRFISNSN